MIERGLALMSLRWLRVTVTNHNQERISVFADTIKEIPEVIECYRMSGETDYLLKVVVSDIESYDNFYKNLIEKVKFLKVTSNFALKKLKAQLKYHSTQWISSLRVSIKRLLLIALLYI